MQATRNDNGTDLMYHFQEEFDKFTKRKAYKKKQHYLVSPDDLLKVIKKYFVTRFSTKNKGGWKDGNLFDEILADTVKQYSDKFKIYFTEEHLNLFCVKSSTTDDLFIYIFTNRRQINNM